MKKTPKGLLVLSLLAGMSALTACNSGSATLELPSSPIQIEDSSDQVIRVTASEKLYVVPDMAELVFEVNSQESTAEATQQANATALEQVLSYLTSTGLEETSIQTSNYNLEPIYDWNNGRSITGYQMSTRITVSDVPLDDAGTLITETVNHGANSVNSVSYFCSTYDDAYQEALQKAIASAKSKAAAIASAGERTLGAMVQVEEAAQNDYARYSRALNSSGMVEETAAAADMSIMAGQLSVEAEVTVSFALE